MRRKKKTLRERDEEILSRMGEITSRPWDYVSPEVARKRAASKKQIEAMILAVQWQNLVKERTDVLVGILKEAKVGKDFMKALEADFSGIRIGGVGSWTSGASAGIRRAP